MKQVESVFAVTKTQGLITIQQTLKESELITLYLDYVNNFLTVDRFAEYYSYPKSTAMYIIEKGKELINLKNNK